jgi:hypothetical protein
MAIFYLINRKVAAETIQGGNYSRDETIRRNTISIFFSILCDAIAIKFPVCSDFKTKNYGGFEFMKIGNNIYVLTLRCQINQWARLAVAMFSS